MYVHFVVVVFSFYFHLHTWWYTSLAATCGPGVFLPATCVDIVLALKQLALCGVGSICSDIC